jgi:urease accessory protein
MKIKPFVFSIAAFSFAPATFAHVFGAHGAGFAEGFAHPFTGLDHLLAMLAAGVWAAQLGGRALRLLPLAFLAIMAGASLLAQPGMNAVWIEFAVAGSVFALGLSVAFAARPALPFSLLAVSLFAAFHGYAHGLEMPQAASPWAYGLGFLLASSGLLLAGLACGLSAGARRLATRAGGALIAAVGLLMLATA